MRDVGMRGYTKDEVQWPPQFTITIPKAGLRQNERAMVDTLRRGHFHVQVRTWVRFQRDAEHKRWHWDPKDIAAHQISKAGGLKVKAKRVQKWIRLRGKPYYLCVKKEMWINMGMESLAKNRVRKIIPIKVQRGLVAPSDDDESHPKPPGEIQ